MGRLEHTPEPWKAAPTDEYGTYRIPQIAIEQRDWVDEGHEISEEEGEHRNGVAEYHDKNNSLLISGSPTMYRKLYDTIAFLQGLETRDLYNCETEELQEMVREAWEDLAETLRKIEED